MFLKLLTHTWLALSIAMTTTAGALAAEDAKSIMAKSRELRKGFVNSVADVKMTLYAGGSQTAVRAMRQYVLEVKGDGNRTINVFSKPADVSGVSLLTHSALSGDDKQWLFLPSIRRVKRISSSNRSGAFVGSEFAYEDLSSFEVEKYSYKSAGTEMLDGRNVFVVDYAPQYSNSGYSRLRTYLDASNYQPIRIDYFNRREEHFKMLILSNYRAYNGDRAWRPHRLEMQNLSNGKSTTINFSTFQPSNVAAVGFDSRRFKNAR